MISHAVLSPTRLRFIRLLLGIFVAALVVSGLTAFPLAWELRVLGMYPSGAPRKYPRSD